LNYTYVSDSLAGRRRSVKVLEVASKVLGLSVPTILEHVARIARQKAEAKEAKAKPARRRAKPRRPVAA
jgi:predicted ATP-grasp superfamily ATP-dependent carboligase